MASITLTIPDTEVQRYINAFTLPYGQTATAANAKARLIYLCQMVVREYEQEAAARAARASIVDIPAT